MTDGEQGGGLHRRGLLALATGALLGSQTGAARADRRADTGRQGDGQDAAALQADLERLAGFGNIRSGSDGDRACAAWIAGRLENAGFSVERQSVDIPVFRESASRIDVGGESLAVFAQPPVRPTGPEGLSAPLQLYRNADDLPRLAGRIAVIVLPFARHSSLLSPPIAARLQAVAAAGAQAAVLVTTGPTGQTLALNTPVETESLPDLPLACLGNRAGDALVEAAAAGQEARLVIAGEVASGTTDNIIGERPGAGPALVLSTPRSGWFSCVAERGPGIACFLRLIDRLPAGRRIVAVASSGHEYENEGAHAFMDTLAPPPDEVALWVHLGAGFAARDWHKAGPRLLPLPSADPQRFLLGSADLVPALRRHFAGISGLEAAYDVSAGAAGETALIAGAGYDRMVGLLGAHRFHHAESDDLRMTSGALVAPVYRALQAMIADILSSG